MKYRNTTSFLITLVIGNVFILLVADDIKTVQDFIPKNSRNNAAEVLKSYDLVFDQQKIKLQQLKHEKTLHVNKNDSNKSFLNDTQKLNIGVFSMGLLNLEPWQVKCAVNVLFGGINSSHHYGCYCGRGNKMENGDPIDAIDLVCQRHDQCYLNCDKIPNCVLKTGATYKWVKDAQNKVINDDLVFDYSIDDLVKHYCLKSKYNLSIPTFFQIQCMDHLNDECEKRYCECDRALISEMVNATNSLGACPKDTGCEKLDAWKTKT